MTVYLETQGAQVGPYLFSLLWVFIDLRNNHLFESRAKECISLIPCASTGENGVKVLDRFRYSDSIKMTCF